MCGIAGTTRKGEIDLEKILKTMNHRGPDARGYYISDVKLFHTRLSILDLEERSNQPFWSNDKSVAIVFNGEIYNFLNLKQALSHKYKFYTKSDTEVLLYGYLEWGNKLWEKLDGMFAVAVYDKVKEKIILAKDHAGIKPLWYSCNSGELTWASELRTLGVIEKQFGSNLVLDLQNIDFYLALGYIPTPHSLYKNVFQLEASSYLEYELGSGKVQSFKYNNIAEFKDDVPGSILASIEDSVLSHLVADVPVGLFFSGGMDSSLIAAILKKHKINLRAYSLSMPGRNLDQEFSKSIGNFLNLDLKNFEFNRDAFQESYRDVVDKIDIPIADIAIFPGSYISKQAAKEVKVVLSGEGGDELYFGYARHRVLNKVRSNSYLARILGFYLSLPNHKYKGYLFQKISSKLDAANYYISTCSPFFNNLNHDNTSSTVKLLNELDPMSYDKDVYLENMLLRKLDFVTMSHSIEGRVPLLSNSMFSESERRKNSFNGSVLKSELKNALLELLPRHLVERPKSGFGFRVENYLKDNAEIKNDFEAAKEYLYAQGVNLTSVEYDSQQSSVLPTVLLHKSIVNVVS